jgi:hypothetical protein
MHKLKKRIVQYATLIFGILLFVGAVLLGRWINLEPVHSPVGLEQGQPTTVTFVPHHSAEYLIEIEVERSLPFDEVSCLLGIGAAVSNNCKTVRSRIDLAWEIHTTDTGELLARGSSAEETGGAWGDTMSRIVGRFLAEAGVSYDLVVASKAAEVLPASLNPHISVKIDPLVSKAYFVASGVLQWLGLAFVLVGAAALAVSFRRNRSD